MTRRAVSLRARLLLGVGATALVALVAAEAVTYVQLRSFLVSQVDQSLVAADHSLAQVLGGHGPGPGGGPGGLPAASASGSGSDSGSGSASDGVPGPPPVADLTQRVLAATAPGTFVEVKSASGAVLVEVAAHEPGGSSALPALPSGLAATSAVPRPGSAVTTGSARAGGPSFRVLASTLPDGELVVGAPLDATTATLHRLLAVELAVTLAALVVAGLLGWWLVRLGLRPLAEVEATAQSIAAGCLDERVPGDDARTEVGQLARALNVMLGRIQQAFAQRDATESELRRSERRLRQSEARMRRFVADASHELRTPLAAVAAYAELFRRGASSRPDDLARVLTGIEQETTRMGHLVQDLLLLARLDEGRPLERQPVELVSLVAEALSTAGAVGPQWPVTLRAREPVEAAGDEARLRQVMDNLLANVRAHTPEGTATVVRVGRLDGHAVVEVTDDGPGLPENEAARIFERFYRADPSRTRASGGSGLGLSIVASIVEAHGGTVAASSPPGRGLAVRVTLPLADPARDEPAPDPPRIGTGAAATRD